MDVPPRRYITRARAQAGGDAGTAPALRSAATRAAATRATRSTLGGVAKRKALSESSAGENSRGQTEEKPRQAPAARITRSAKPTGNISKRPATRIKSTVSSSSGLTVGPRRSGRTGTNRTRPPYSHAATKTLLAQTLVPTRTKKVTFAPSPRSDDKENALPPKPPVTPEKTKQEQEETDELMSTSMGALSVKPIRPRTALQLPTTGVHAPLEVEPTPALSPQKAQRPKRLFAPEDKSLEDELLAPTSPALAAKPKRPMPSLGTKNISDGADLLFGPSKAPKLSALLSSPAKRLPQSPFKTTGGIGDGADLLGQKTTQQPTGINSPAKRPPVSPIKNAGPTSAAPESVSRPVGINSPAKRPPVSPIKNTAPTNAAPESFSKPSGLAIPPRRIIRPGPKLNLPTNSTNKSNMKGSSLKFSISMDLNDDPFTDSNAPSVTDKPERKLFVKEQDPIMEETEMKDEDGTVQEEEDSTTPPGSPTSRFAPAPISPTSSPTDNIKANIPTNVQQEDAEMKEEVEASKEEAIEKDADGDITMDETPTTPEPVVPPMPTCETVQSKHHRTPSQGGSSFGLFLEDDDEDMDYDSENIPPPVLAIPSSVVKTDIMDNDIGKFGRGFGQEIDLSVAPVVGFGYPEIPVDPMLLGEDMSDVVNGYTETSLPTSTMPVKFHCDEDDIFGDVSAQNNSHIYERTGNVLAGAVVYVDAWTNDGANCGEAFEKTLRAMGARVLKQWTWNPDACSPGKVGITHVVFKDGSPRTLQKVKATNGLVSCVALAWVMDCAQQDEWLDESVYAIDLDEIPRGGHRVCLFSPSDILFPQPLTNFTEEKVYGTHQDGGFDCPTQFATSREAEPKPSNTKDSSS